MRAAPRSPAHASPLRAALALIALLLSACHRQPAAASPSKSATASPVVRGTGSGLEVWTWTVSDRRVAPAAPPSPDGKPPPPPAVRLVDSREDLEAVLLPYLDRPVPMPDDLRDRWRACGLRIVAVPVSALDHLPDRMRLVGQVQRQWLGELTSWTDIVHSPTFDTKQSAALDTGTMQLDPGRLRILARCWSSPATNDRGSTVAALRLELVPHHLAKVDPTRQWRAVAGFEPANEGLRFERLAAGFTLTQSQAFVIVADNPDTDWAHASPPPSDDPATTGPVPPRASTLGELLLSSPATPTQPRMRAVMVLLLRVPDRFDLLP